MKTQRKTTITHNICRPQTNMERVFACALTAIGSMCVAVIFGNVILLIECVVKT